MVVAVDRNGKLADFSSRCGNAQKFCLAAPGERIVVREENRGRGDNVGKFVEGTSFAAPLVSGGLAVLRQYFSEGEGDERTYQLGNTELVARLLATANRKNMTSTGGPDYSDPEKYGHGLMDLEAATEALRHADDLAAKRPQRPPFDASAFSLSGNAFGGAMRDSLGGVKIAAFDELDAPFFFPLAAGVSHAPQISAGHSDTLHEHELSSAMRQTRVSPSPSPPANCPPRAFGAATCGSPTDTTADAKPDCISAMTAEIPVKTSA